MASEAHGRSARPGPPPPHGIASALSTTNSNHYDPFAAPPPPSTLAAQLVENISASARSASNNFSARPADETAELKRLFATIERVNNDPAGRLQTPEEREEHNHLLVYVCGGVFLDGLRLDDAFADGERLRADARKAIGLLRVTIRETPGVLLCVTDGTLFLGRGKEPLWVWILPRLLRMLGHRRCAEIAKELEDLCRWLLLLAAATPRLWELGRLMMEYFRENLNGALWECLR